LRRCPDCSETLYARKVGAVEVDGCASCGGLWLDEGELGALGRAAPEQLVQLDHKFRPGMMPAIAPQRSNACPACGQALTAVPHPMLPDLELDACRNCRGVWLNHGELTQIAERSDRGTRARPVPAPFDDLTSTHGLPIVHGRALHRVDHEFGLSAKLKRAFRFIQSAFALAVERKALLAPILIGFGVQLVVGSLFFMALLRSDLLVEVETTDSVPPQIALGFLAWTLLFHFINHFAMGMSVSMVDGYLKGLPPKLGVAFRDAMKNIAGIVVLAVVSTVVEMITNAMQSRRRGAARLVLAPLAAAIQAAWTIASFLLLPIIMIEDVRLGVAIDRARDIHRNNLVQIAVGEVGLYLVNQMVVVLLVLSGMFVAWALAPFGATAVLTGVALVVLAAILLAAVLVFAKAAYYACLYLWAAQMEEAADVEQVLVPAPLVAALS
jgi:Zn-finger nucleic acid-binding protein